MASDFPIQYYTGHENGPQNMYYVPDATNGAAIVKGDLVLKAADGECERCATDPAAILGIAKASFADKFLYANPLVASNAGRLPIFVLTPATRIGLCVGAGTLALANKGIDYGISLLASGNWAVNLADTTGPTFHIIEVDVANQIAWGYFLATALTEDAIAS